MPRPLQGSYWATVVVVIAALAPFIVVTTASELLAAHVGADLGAGRTALQIALGLSEAAYAFGALAGGDVAQRFPQRPLHFIFTIALLAGFLLAATAPGYVQYAAGVVLEGLATGFLLVVAVPPLVQTFPTARLPHTTAIVNIGFFGAVAAGPVVGGAVAHVHAWRWLHGGLGAVVVLGILVALVTLPSRPPPDPDLRLDAPALVLGLAAMVLCFLAVSRLQAVSFSSAFFVGLLTAGVVALLSLLVVEYRLGQAALSPVQPLSSTIPSVGTLAATVGGGAFVALVLLGQRYLREIAGREPIGIALDFLPQIGGVLVAALLLGLLVRTRYLPHLTLAGMVALAGAAVVLVLLGEGGGRPLVLLGTGLLGFGAGASVSPGLWIAGMSLPVRLVGRTFALVELVRSAGDFVLAPVLGKVATVHGGGSVLHGLHVAVWATLALTVAGTLAGVLIWWAGRAGAQKPDLEGWQEEGGVAFHSPRQLARFRGEPEPG